MRYLDPPIYPPIYPDVSQARHLLIRVLVAASLLVGLWYISWQYTDSINWGAWWMALPLIVAETYSCLDAWLFGLTVWRLKRRGEPPAPQPGTTVDVLITC